MAAKRWVLNAKMASVLACFHCIGKVWHEEARAPLTQSLNGAAKSATKSILKICNAIGAHHDEIEMTTMISPIVQACDAIAGARPGGPREVYG